MLDDLKETYPDINILGFRIIGSGTGSSNMINQYTNSYDEAADDLLPPEPAPHPTGEHVFMNPPGYVAGELHNFCFLLVTISVVLMMLYFDCGRPFSSPTPIGAPQFLIKPARISP